MSNSRPNLLKTRPSSALVAALVLTTFASRAASAQAPVSYDEPFRPQFHFSPETNWMNDPNGLVFFDGEYHLFYQYNPEGNGWGHMSWGHAVSPDLVRWKHLPVALKEENGVMIFSGSAVVDHNNTSGVGKDGQPPMVAVYTGHGHNKQTQNIAYSTDRGRTWTKYANNPVIDIGSPEFRDPKVIWHAPTKQWVMVVARPDQRKVLFWGSPNLKDWKQLGEFGNQGATEGIWECPDLFELPVYRPVRKQDGSGWTMEKADRKRWVLVVNINGGTPAGGSGCQYFVGHFDGKTFANDNPKETVLWADWGADFYAAQSWTDAPSPDGSRPWLAWMSNWRYANEEPTSPWRTAMTLPRELRLDETARGLRLCQHPAKTAASLRLGPAEGGLSSAWVLKDADLVAGTDPLRGKLTGDRLELQVTFSEIDADEVGLKVRVGNGQETVIGFDAKNKQVFIDRTRSGVNFHKEFPARHAAAVAAPDKSVTLQVWVDRSSIEVLAQGGLVSITDRIFPDPTSQGVSVYASGGNAKVKQMFAWKLKSAWR